MAEVWQCPRCKAQHPPGDWASRYGIATCGRCLQFGYVILPETLAGELSNYTYSAAVSADRLHGEQPREGVSDG